MATATAPREVAAKTRTSFMKAAFCALLLVAACLTAWHVRVLKSMDKPHPDTAFPWTQVDILPIWVGGRLTFRHINPYTNEATRTIQRAYFGRVLTARDHGINPYIDAYPPQTPFVLFPIVLLPWQLASVAFLIASIEFVALIGPVWLRVLHIERSEFLTVLCVMASWPALWGIRVENPSMIAIPAIGIAVWFYSLRRDTGAGIVLALTAIKPQLCWLLILWMLVHATVHRRMRFIVALCGTGAALMAISYAWLPGCFRAWYGSFHNYLEPTKMYVPFPWLVAFLMLLLIPSLYKLRKDFGTSVALILAVTTAAIPTSPWTTYNYLLLIPACLLVLGKRGFLARAAVALLVLEYLLPCAAAVADFRGSHLLNAVPGLNTLLPIVLALSLMATAQDHVSHQFSV